MLDRLEVSETIERPAEDVFAFVVEHHVDNHPRWDPGMSMEQVTPGPIAVGTLIRRQRERDGQVTEGEMEVTAIDPGRSMSAEIRDGDMVLSSSAIIESEAPDRTRLTFTIEADFPVAAMEQPVRGSLARIKEMLESEA